MFRYRGLPALGKRIRNLAAEPQQEGKAKACALLALPKPGSARRCRSLKGAVGEAPSGPVDRAADRAAAAGTGEGEALLEVVVRIAFKDKFGLRLEFGLVTSGFSSGG